MKIQLTKFNFLKLFLPALIVFSPIQKAKSEKIHLTCVGNFEINRGPLIKPDWHRSYLTMNIEGILRTPSTIISEGVSEGGFPKRGRTIFKNGSYHIAYLGKEEEVLIEYIVNLNNGNYSVSFPKKGRVLLGTCKKVKL